MEKIIGTVPGKCRKKREKARLTLNNNPEISWHMKKSRRTYNGVHLNKKSNTQDVVEQSLTLHQKSTNKQIKTKNMTENKTSKMNLDHERKIVELQERVNKLEDLCFTTKEILNLEEASAFLGIAKSTLYKMTHLNQLPFFKPAGKLIFFEKKALLDWVRGAKSLSEEEIRAEAAARLNDMNNRP